ncbi:MAG TPA: D-cysteine desulfhydrase family protein [Rectinemataceae bacterium]|nr:D-cysteine desulfhydrase family protein [Rectinemataceae bacterium]
MNTLEKQPARMRFAHLPTPVEELRNLSAELGGPRVFVKRDDETGLALGGNKTRKLEFLVADALARGARTIVTAGAAQSNHCRQTAAAAAKFGLGCVLVLNGAEPEALSANLLLDKLFGVRILWVANRDDRESVQAKTCAELEAAGAKPYFMPYGGSSPVGALGYAFAVEEALAQGVDADWFVFGTSSGGTHAGLALGAKLFGYRGRVLGISIDESEAWLKARVSALASDASELLGGRIEIGPEEILANDSYCSAGYGVLTGAEVEAVKLFARTEGLLLDPVYTGRAAAGLVDLIRKGRFRKDESVLFWNTGGQPALFAEKYQRFLAQA